MDDVVLGIGIKEGKEQAFAQFFDKYHSLLLAYMTTYTGNRNVAEEMVQQAFVTLWEKRELLDAAQSPRHYLFAIAQNLFKKKHRELRKRDSFLEELKLQEINKALEDPDNLEKRLKRLREIMETLPPRCREILVLNKFEGLKYQQIADRMEISVKTVESQMRIAYKKIREGFASVEGTHIGFQKRHQGKDSNSSQKTRTDLLIKTIATMLLSFFW